MQPETITHLTFIQQIITRMASNSFNLKGWTVAMVAAIFALSSEDSSPWFSGITIFTTIIFWYLDGYYLRQERAYRQMYNAVVIGQPSVDILSLNAGSFLATEKSIWRIMLSQTLIIFYGFMMLICLTLATLLNLESIRNFVNSYLSKVC